MVSDPTREDEADLVEEAADAYYPRGGSGRPYADVRDEHDNDFRGYWSDQMGPPAEGREVECVMGCGALLYTFTDNDVACRTCEKGW